MGRVFVWFIFVVCVALVALGGGCQTAGIQHSKPTSQPVAGADVDLALFYEKLTPLGAWVEMPELGPCWYPYEPSPGWKPYGNGRWVYSDATGWAWVGAEKWSWATDHYGRWVFRDSHGWLWAPDRVWSPAWVQWRRGSGYVGWAPLPITREDANADINVIDANAKEFPSSAWTFAREKFLADEKLRERAESVTRNVTLLGLTENATKYEVTDRGIINRGPDIEQIEKVADKPIPRFTLMDLPTARPAEVREGEANVVAFYRTELGPRPNPPPPTPHRTRDLTLLAMEEERQRQADYHDQLRETLEMRHEREREEAKLDADQSSLISRQKRERTALLDQRQREVEALRRRQRDVRNTIEAQQAESARLARDKQKGGDEQTKLIPIPKEWELPPGMMRRE